MGRHIRQLEKAGLILPVRQYGYLRNEKYRHTFWQATKDSGNALGYEQYTPIGEKSVLNFRHQFGLIDVLCGLYFPYRDKYEFTVSYPSTAHSLDGYKPDAIVKYRHKFVGQLLWLARKLPDYQYRFALLHQFKEFESAVWVMPGGRNVKIINKNNT